MLHKGSEVQGPIMVQKAAKEAGFSCCRCGRRIVRGEGYVRRNGKPEHVGCPPAARPLKRRRLRPRGTRAKRA